ncbi:MAG TPA: ribosome maturation factor RimM [Rhizomicrobium sp.]|jgi:16S rRNA processing protein RimM
MPRDVLLGVVMGAQGLKGEVKVKTFTQSPEGFGAYGQLHDKSGRTLTVASIRAGKDGAVVRFAEIGERDGAEALKGAELFVSRDRFPPAESEEFYLADLIGLAAEDTEGRTIGIVRAIHNFGAGDVIEIVRADGDEVFLPFTREVAREIDVAEGRIVIAAPEEVEAETKGNVE